MKNIDRIFIITVILCLMLSFMLIRNMSNQVDDLTDKEKKDISRFMVLMMVSSWVGIPIIIIILMFRKEIFNGLKDFVGINY